MDPAVISRIAPEIPFVCKGMKCTKPGCRSVGHRKCKMFKCILPAGYGPDNTRVYCKGCQPKTSVTYNGYACIVCGKGEKKRPARYGQFNCIPTHCENCGPPLSMRLLHVRNGFCQFELDNGTACVAEASFEVDGEKRCKEHRDGAAVTNLKLYTEPGCKKFKVQRGYCNAHAMLHKIPVSTCYVDCLKKPEFKMGTNASEIGRLCVPCTEARIGLCEDFRWWRIGGYWCVNCDVVSAKYGPEGGTPLYCVKCKDLCGHPEMRDIVNRRCIEPGCKTIAGFGIEWGNPQHCVHHRTSDEVNATNLVCVDPGCKTKASKRVIQGQRKHCARHRQPGEKDVISKPCPNCTVMLQSQTKFYQPHCFRCFLVLNPTVEVTRQYLVKEKAFMGELSKAFPTMTLNRTIAGGSSRRRPGGYVNCGTHVVIVEIDEGQHAAYDPEDEVKRMEEIFKDVRKKPIVSIRLNPDAYKTRDDVTVPSIFKRTLKGAKRDTAEFDRRFSALLAEVHRGDWYPTQDSVQDRRTTNREADQAFLRLVLIQIE